MPVVPALARLQKRGPQPSGSLGIPGLSGFIAEFQVFTGSLPCPWLDQEHLPVGVV